MELEIEIGNKADNVKLKKIAKALADLKRLEILKLIADDDDEKLNYGAIAKAISRSPTSITNHMSWIRNSGLVEDLIIEGMRGKMQKIPKLKITKIIIKLK